MQLKNNEDAKKPRMRRGTKLQLEAPLPRRRADNENVFVNESFEVPIVRKRSEGYKQVDVNGIAVWKRFGYNEEYTSFTKVFITPKTKLKVAKLSLRAKEMFLHIIMYVRAGDSKIKLDKDEYCKLYDIKATTFSNTRMELMEAHIILDVKREKDMYWINPFYLFNGNRLSTFEPFLKIEYSYFQEDGYAEKLAKIKKDYWEGCYVPEKEEE